MKQPLDTTLFAVVSLLLPGIATIHGQTVIATNEEVPMVMADTSGTPENPSIYRFIDYTSDPDTFTGVQVGVGFDARHIVFEIDNSTVDLSGSVNVSWRSAIWQNDTGGSYNTMRIENGSSVLIAGSFQMGRYSESTHNRVLVSGTGTTLTSSGQQFRVGFEGAHNEMTIEDGAQVTRSNTGIAYIGSTLDTSNSNRLEVVGTGSSLDFNCALVVGLNDGNRGNSFSVRGGATAAVSTLSLGSTSAGSGGGHWVKARGSGSRIWANSGLELRKSDGNHAAFIENGALLRCTHVNLDTTVVGNTVNLADGWLAVRLNRAETYIHWDALRLYDAQDDAFKSLNALDAAQREALGWSLTYYADTEVGEAAALEATGYAGLRNHTVFTGGDPRDPLVAIPVGTLLLVH